MSSRLSDYDFELPAGQIASRPLPERDASRMMVLHREGERIEHRAFRDLPEFVRAGDLFVLNNTRVVPARQFSDDGRVEFLFVENMGEQSWKCLVKPGRRMRLGAVARVKGTVVRVTEILPTGERVVVSENDIDLQQGGALPIPPYLGRPADSEDDVRYQTIYAERPGAVAAPTAGLHFTRELLATIPHAFVTLHVGLGTFQPVQAENVDEHRMHAERYEIAQETADQINLAQRRIAVGTTSVRVLESSVGADGRVQARRESTDIFIRPPFQFRAVDALLTNFHLPRSTLLMLVSAFAGREFTLRAYADAVREGYRFFSYGDCMLIL